MGKNKKTMIGLSVMVVSTFLVALSAQAGYKWKDYFSFESVVSIRKVANAAVISGLKNSRDWKDVISGKNIKDGTITADKLAEGVISTYTLSDSSVTSDKIASGTIVNADVSSSAAIAGTKINPDFGSQDIATTGDVTAVTFTGNLTGNVTGNLTGNVTGNVTGNLTGNVTGNAATATTATTATNATTAANASGSGTAVYSAQTGLKIVHGRINGVQSDPSCDTITGSGGFTCLKTGTGIYVINFSPAFTNPPTVSISTNRSTGFPVASRVEVSDVRQITIHTYANDGTDTHHDATEVDFIAMQN